MNHLRKEEVQSRYILCIIRTSIDEDDLYVVHQIQNWFIRMVLTGEEFEIYADVAVE